MTSEVAHQDPRALWQAHIRRALAQPYLMMLMLGSLLLSAASFFTTYVGMLHFMPVVFVTFCIVFAIQALLFVTSWRIGFALADREETPLFTVIVFLICISTSVFFSWVALFESINTEEAQSRTRETRIHRAVEDTITELQIRSLEARRTQVEALIASPAYVSWTDGLDRLAAEAKAAVDVIEDARDAQASATAQRIQTLEAERARVLRSEATRTEGAAAARRELEALEAERPALLERRDRLRAERDLAREKVVIQEGLMNAEETGGAAGQGSGKGPIWRQLRDQRNVMAAERDAKEQLFTQAEADLAALDARLTPLRAEVAASGGAASDGELAVIERRLAEMKNDGAAVLALDVGALDAEVAAMRADMAAFATRFELEPFDQAAARCARLLETMRANATLAPRLEGVACDRSGLAPMMNPIRVAIENQARLAASCASDGAASRTISTLGFEDAVGYGRGCIDASGLPAASVADLREEIARLVLEEDPNASAFVKTMNAFTGGDKLAYFSLAIALFIDTLVLFSGLIGAMSATDTISRHFDKNFRRTDADNFMNSLKMSVENDEEIPVAAALFRHMRPFIGEEIKRWGRTFVQDQGFVGQVVLHEVLDDVERQLLQQFLMEQVSSGGAVPKLIKTALAPGGQGYKFLLRKNVIDAVRDVYLNPDRIDSDFNVRLRKAPRGPKTRTVTIALGRPLGTEMEITTDRGEPAEARAPEREPAPEDAPKVYDASTLRRPTLATSETSARKSAHLSAQAAGSAAARFERADNEKGASGSQHIDANHAGYSAYSEASSNADLEGEPTLSDHEDEAQATEAATYAPKRQRARMYGFWGGIRRPAAPSSRDQNEERGEYDRGIWEDEDSRRGRRSR